MTATMSAVSHNAPAIFPEDCIGELERIPSVPIDDLIRGQHIKIMVGNLYSPSHFWIIRDDNDNYSALCNLNHQMTEYYDFGEGRKLKHPQSGVQVGQTCAALRLGEWRRAVVMKLNNSYSVKVFYIDLGIASLLYKTSTKPLKREWCSLPAQAVRARLAFLVPPGYLRRWPLNSTTVLADYVMKKPVTAQVVELLPQENELRLWVWGSENETVMYDVNNQLVLEGQASYSSQTLELYKRPSWWILESGATPQYDVLLELERNNQKPRGIHEYVPPDGLTPLARHRSLPLLAEYPYNSFKQLQVPPECDAEPGPSTTTFYE